MSTYTNILPHITSFINNNLNIHVLTNKQLEQDRFRYIDNYFTRYNITNITYHEYTINHIDKQLSRENYHKTITNKFIGKYNLLLESGSLFKPDFIEKLYNLCREFYDKSYIIRLCKQNILTANLYISCNKDKQPVYKTLDLIVSGTKITRHKSIIRYNKLYDIYFSINNKKHYQFIDTKTHDIQSDNSIKDNLYKQTYTNNIKHTYFIVSNEHEPSKYQYIQNFIKEYLQDNTTTSCYLWGNQITYQHRSKFSYTMSNSVISLILNYIQVFKEIANTKPKDTDNFLIMESDSLISTEFFETIHKTFTTINEHKIQYDYIDISNGMGYFPDRFGYTNRDGLFLCTKMRCAGAIIYTYKFIRLVLDYFTKTTEITNAIDEIYNILIDKHNLIVYWTYPSVVIQGSQYGIMNSVVQSGDVIWDTTPYRFINYDMNLCRELLVKNVDMEYEVDDKIVCINLSKQDVLDMIYNDNITKKIEDIEFTMKVSKIVGSKLYIKVICSMFVDEVEVIE